SRKVDGLTDRAPSVVFSPDGKTLAATGSKEIRLWDAHSGKELRQFDAELAVHTKFGGEHIIPLAFSPDGQLLGSVAPDQSVRVWETKTGKERLKLVGHAVEVCCLCFSPDGKRLASASGNGVDAGHFFAWDVASGKELLERPLGNGRTLQMLPLTISPDSTSVACHVHSAEAVQLVDVNTGRILQSLPC